MMHSFFLLKKHHLLKPSIQKNAARTEFAFNMFLAFCRVLSFFRYFSLLFFNTPHFLRTPNSKIRDPYSTFST